MVAPLVAWMNGERVGVWSNARGVHSFAYDASWIASARGRSLSLSLPMVAEARFTGAKVENYFDNLLPDNEALRRRIQTRYKTGSVAAFDLLEAIGRDCVGAVQLLPEKDTPEGFDRLDATPLSDLEVEAHLRASMLPSPMATVDDDDFRISIAGAQEKTALLLTDGRWHRPKGMTPTSHILKLPLGLVGGLKLDLGDSVENEWLCLQLLKRMEFRVAETSMQTFGATKALVSERFDRRWSTRRTWLARLPQEDTCQALGRPGSQKYERDGGPSMADVLSVLRGSASADDDRMHFLLTQFVFWLLAAIDGHAKNFSVSIQAGDRYSLTPLYDVLSAWPIISPKQLQYQHAKLAMAVRATNAHYRLDEIRTDHWHTLAIKSGMPDAWPRMKEIAAVIGPTLSELGDRLPAGFPGHVYDSIAAGVKKHAEKFLRGVAAAE